MIFRRNINRALATAPAFGYAAPSLAQDNYPERPIRLLVGLAPAASRTSPPASSHRGWARSWASR